MVGGPKGHRLAVLVAGVVALAVAVTLSIVRPWATDEVEAAPEDPPSPSPTPTTPEPETSVSGVVTASGLDLHHPDGASLVIGPGDLPPGTRVELAFSGADPVEDLGPLQPDGASWSILASAEPERPVELTIPYDPSLVTGDAQALVASYDELAEMWLPVETYVDADAGLLRGWLPSFSFKTWITDRFYDVSGAVSWLEYGLWRALGSRAARPDCSSSPQPPWIADVVTNPDPNARLFACVGAEGDGFAVKLTNNRGYPVAVEFDRPFTDARPEVFGSGLPGLAAYLASHLAAATGQVRVPVGATSSAVVAYAPVDAPSGMVEGRARRDTAALLMFLAMEFAHEIGADLVIPGGKTVGLWTLDCFARVVPAGSSMAELDVFAAGNQLTGCLSDTLTHEVRKWGFDPAANNGNHLWSRAADNLPTDAKRMVKALRILKAISIGKWLQTAADLFVDNLILDADLIDVSVRWNDTGTWGAGGEGGVYLYQLPSVHHGPGIESGTLTAGLLDGVSYPRSTSAWVGCDGTASTLTYNLTGEYGSLSGTVGLAPHTPDDVVARIGVTGDGELLASLEVSTTRIQQLEVDLSGVSTMEISAERIAGHCEISPTPYGVLGNAYAVPTADTLMELSDDYLGTWSGAMTQPTSSRSPYSMEATLWPGAVGDEVGEVTYLDLSCGGRLILVRSGTAGVVLNEQIDYGLSACVTNGYHDVRPAANGSLQFEWFSGASLSGPPDAWATLHR